MRDSIESLLTDGRSHARARRVRDAAPKILFAVGLIAAILSGVVLTALARSAGL